MRPWFLTRWTWRSGENKGLDVEEKMLAAMLDRTTTEGLYLNPPLDAPGAWWRMGGAGGREKRTSKEDFTNVGGMAVMLNALTTRSLRDDDPALRERARQIADALSRIAIRKDDYAYYPPTTDFGLEYASVCEGLGPAGL